MPSLCDSAEQWVACLHHIEDLGFHAVTVSEHYTHGWAMDALTAMNFALASTTRLRAIPMVLNNDLHHPAVLAKAVATADVLSGGRSALGIGAGWLVDDYTALGASYDAASIRIDRLEEALQVIGAYFADTAVTFDGHHYKVTDFQALPRAVQTPRPPILVGGGGAKVLAVAGRHADIVGVHAQLGPGGFDEAAASGLSRENIDKKISLVIESASRAHRPAPEIMFTCYDVNIGGVRVTPIRPAFSDYIGAHYVSFVDSPVSLHGDVERCVDKLQRWREQLGITYWNIGGNLDVIAPIVEKLSTE